MMNRWILLLVLPFLFSFTFAPMSQTIELTNDRQAVQFFLENDSPASMAVELTIKERSMDQAGNENLAASEEVKVFPPQVIIPAGEKRAIRVSYSGTKDLKIEKNYRVIAEQLPLNVDAKTKEKAGIQMLMKYVAALYVAPANAKSDLKILSHAANGKVIKLLIENSGTRHQLLNAPVLKYSVKDKKHEIKAEELQGLAGENVLAGTKREFVIKSTKSIPADAKLELKFND
jgi:fimbrial chaperone protein